MERICRFVSRQSSSKRSSWTLFPRSPWSHDKTFFTCGVQATRVGQQQGKPTAATPEVDSIYRRRAVYYPKHVLLHRDNSRIFGHFSGESSARRKHVTAVICSSPRPQLHTTPSDKGKSLSSGWQTNTTRYKYVHLRSRGSTAHVCLWCVVQKMFPGLSGFGGCTDRVQVMYAKCALK